MAASKFFLMGTSLFRETFHKTLSPPFPSFKPLHFHRQCSSSSAAAVVTAGNTLQHHQQHPWPEWVTFVDKLKAKGYFTEHPAIDGESSTVEEAEAERLYTDMNQLKYPCLSFARDRYDVFKSLSLPEIKTVVEGGCPNLLRKVVNSAKRLRVHVQLDEGNVCSGCNLRGSCDRAYVLLKGNEADPRTVDIVRLLFFYALDPLVISGGEKPPGRELVELSVRKLLSELIELSETAPDPALPKPAKKVVPKKEPDVNFSEEKLSGNVEMKRGDWLCPKCNFMNFSRNIRCLKCSEEPSKRAGANDIEMKKGDWICANCNFMNFWRNRRCLKCKSQGPERVNVNDVEMKKGDWNCSGCGFMNFASNKKCLRCQESRPKRLLNPGEWECPSCDFLNYKRNVVCLKCNCERPKGKTTEYDEHTWRSPSY